ncbi:hypothetical protein [Nocardiopsis sp. CNT312]|uniref:hypothetical protein n=1 Tax=Nocardiopsis sp. CNT312 TaxID=1137268 RepID=UPI0004B79740|nr:hypothetical protein [Nocardiopsis sp. CNT312]
MFSRRRPTDPVRAAAGQSPGARRGRRAVRSLALAVTLSAALGVGACGGAEEQPLPEDPNAEAAARLNEAQPTYYEDATLLPEGSESGTYSRLATVRYSEEVRGSTEIDKPECVDAANRWGDMESVRDAPTSVAAYEWPEGSVSSMLIQLDEAEAVRALETGPPESCSAYTVTYEDGTASEYTVAEVDLPRIGDESHAFSVEVTTGGEVNRMINVLYRNGDLLGSTSVLGTGDIESYREMLAGFSEAAVDRQQRMLG